MSPRPAPWGSWDSPLSAGRVARAGTRIYQPRRAGDTLYWLEVRPAEGGRTILVRERAGRREELNPPPWSVRSRVHEYGGGAWCAADDDVWFVNDDDQAIWHRAPDGAIRRMTPAGTVRYADLVRDPARPRLVGICEDHGGTGEPANRLVAIHDDGRVETLQSGRDFYASPRFDVSGTRLCWQAWDHPLLPWDGNELWAAGIDAHGRVSGGVKVAGGAAESIFQPGWLPDGRLGFVADPDGWWNHYAWNGAGIQRLSSLGAEAGAPQWVFGQSTWGAVGERLLAGFSRDGTWHIALLAHGAAAPLDWEPETLEHLAADGRQAVALAGTSDSAMAVYALDAPDFRPRLVAEAAPVPLPPEWISRPQALSWDSGDGRAHGFWYPPSNPSFMGPAGTLPPVLVKCHGGPTGATSAAFDAKTQFWTSRGFGVLDVNYRGSTGYGRAYRESLYARWGVADVEDCVSGVAELGRRGFADPHTAFISGASAGGYTVLCALTFTDAFRGGASYFGIADVGEMFATTHKFEAHYDHWLIGPRDAPETRRRMNERSPLKHAGRIRCPVIFFQGGEDRVVPPEQSRSMHAALQARGITTSYFEFPEEGHGFRRADNIRRALDAELEFFCQILGVTPAV